jgi:hypothetical protein
MKLYIYKQNVNIQQINSFTFQTTGQNIVHHNKNKQKILEPELSFTIIIIWNEF